MKIKKSKKLPIIVVISLVVVALLIVSATLYYRSASQKSSEASQTERLPETTSPNLNKPSSSQLDAGANTKKNTVDKSTETNVSSQSSGKKSTQLTITSSNVSAGKLQLRVLLQDIVSGGTCTLNMTNSNTSKVVSQTSGVQPLPNGSACKGFDVDTADLTDSNKWDVTIAYSDSVYSGKVSQQISIGGSS